MREIVTQTGRDATAKDHIAIPWRGRGNRIEQTRAISLTHLLTRNTEAELFPGRCIRHRKTLPRFTTGLHGIHRDALRCQKLQQPLPHGAAYGNQRQNIAAQPVNGPGHIDTATARIGARSITIKLGACHHVVDRGGQINGRVQRDCQDLGHWFPSRQVRAQPLHI